MEETDKFLEASHLPTLNHKESENLSEPRPSEEINSGNQTSPNKGSRGLFTQKHYLSSRTGHPETGGIARDYFAIKEILMFLTHFQLPSTLLS
jgi:hypothetical protein